jgi:hypothetical protein
VDVRNATRLIGLPKSFFIVQRSDEYHRDTGPGRRQPPTHFYARNATQINVQDQTVRRAALSQSRNASADTNVCVLKPCTVNKRAVLVNILMSSSTIAMIVFALSRVTPSLIRNRSYIPVAQDVVDPVSDTIGAIGFK